MTTQVESARIMTQAEVAAVLRIPESTLQDLARRGHKSIPTAWKVGRAWRWLAEDVDAFVQSRGQKSAA
ncbi:DNA binding domain-containing protein, excisionase family [Nocardioides sp. YR527]|uniref:helix-turn-helix transcriptional regulator n=1 Tax=Nocardioides sp. YR527 TaxID=1881028 RepID=UPI0008815546|nr:DNA binding domain-containing protein, excisionase family [Nocardioides sp. YR527]